jgi:hypothetical protein
MRPCLVAACPVGPRAGRFGRFFLRVRHRVRLTPECNRLHDVDPGSTAPKRPRPGGMPARTGRRLPSAALLLGRWWPASRRREAPVALECGGISCQGTRTARVATGAREDHAGRRVGLTSAVGPPNAPKVRPCLLAARPAGPRAGRGLLPPPGARLGAVDPGLQSLERRASGVNRTQRPSSPASEHAGGRRSPAEARGMRCRWPPEHRWRPRRGIGCARPDGPSTRGRRAVNLGGCDRGGSSSPGWSRSPARGW